MSSEVVALYKGSLPANPSSVASSIYEAYTERHGGRRLLQLGKELSLLGRGEAEKKTGAGECTSFSAGSARSRLGMMIRTRTTKSTLQVGIPLVGLGTW